MENPEEILHSLEEFSKMKPKDIPRELEEYLCFVAKTGDPVYQWSSIKSLFREKLINVITEFYESCPSVEIPPCPNVEIFNYDLMKNFILEKLDTFAAAPFTVQRICELLTTPRKEYNRIDKYMRALEKNILVVSTMEPGNRQNTENGESIMNGIESDHVPEPGSEINVEEMDESPSWPENVQSVHITLDNKSEASDDTVVPLTAEHEIQQNTITSSPFSSIKISHTETTINQEGGLSCTIVDDQQFVSIEPVTTNIQHTSEAGFEDAKEESVTITAVSVSVTSVQSNAIVSEVIPCIESVLKDCGDHTVTEEEKLLKDQISEPTLEPIKLLENQEPEILIAEVLPFSSETPGEIILPKSVVLNEETKEVEAEPIGIENISPETSTSAPETLDLDLNTDTKDASCDNVIDFEDISEEKQEELLLKSEENSQESQELKEDSEKSETDPVPLLSEEILLASTEEEIQKEDEKVEDVSEQTEENITIEDVTLTSCEATSTDVTSPERLIVEENEAAAPSSSEDKAEETLPEKDLDVCKTEDIDISPKPTEIAEKIETKDTDKATESSAKSENIVEKSEDTCTPMDVDNVVSDAEEKTEEQIEEILLSDEPEKCSAASSAVDDLGQSTTL